MAILEHADDIPSVLAFRESSRAPLLIVSASPGVSWELGSRSVPCRDAGSFLDAGAAWQRGMENYGTVAELSRLIDRHLAAGAGEASGCDPRPGSDNFFFTKLLYDAITLRICILRGILREEAPAELISCGGGIPRGGRETGPGTLPFPPEERVFDRILSLPGWGCRWTSLPAGENQPAPAGSGNGPRKGGGFTRRFQGLAPGPARALQYLALGGSLGEDLGIAWHAAANALRGKERLVLMGYGYDWHTLAPDLIRAGYRLSPLPGDIPRKEAWHSPGGRISLPPAGPACTLGGIDFSPLLWERLAPLLSLYLSSFQGTAGISREILGRENTRGLLCSARSTFVEHIQARVARGLGLPVVTWQHGATGYFPWKMVECIELAGSDLHLCFGEGVKERLGDAAAGHSCTMVPAGSCELERIARGNGGSGSEYEVLYATTNYYRNNLYVSGPTLFSDHDLWQTQQAILGTIGELGVKAAFKIHPGNYEDAHIHAFLRDRGYRNITVLKEEGPFRDLLDRSAAVALDFPSTTLLQAIATGKPVFALTRHLPLDTGAEALLRKRAICTGDLAEFTSLLGRYLRHDGGLRLPDPSSREFLERFGVHHGDGGVLGRVLAVLSGLQPGTRAR